MNMTTPTARMAAWLLLALAIPSARADFSVSNNLSTGSGGTESAAGTTYLTAGFGSSTGGQLSAVTLQLSNLGTSTAEVDIYNDDGLNEPGTLVGTLTQTGTISSSLSAVSFTASGISLTASTNYWVVLKALSGTINWSYTSTSGGGGVGAGYQGTWGTSDDAGATWFTYQSYPLQMNVVLASPSAVPEPSGLILLGTALVGSLGCYARRGLSPKAS